MEGEAPTGHLGHNMLHLAKDGSSCCDDALAFVEIVNAHPEAFEVCSSVKLEGAELGVAKNKDKEKKDDDLSPQVLYKMHKDKVVEDVMEKA